MLLIVRRDLSPADDHGRHLGGSQIRMIVDNYQVTLMPLTIQQADRLCAALREAPAVTLQVECLGHDEADSATSMRGTTTLAQFDPPNPDGGS